MFGLFKKTATNGARNITVRNCILSGNRANNATGTTYFGAGSKAIYIGPTAYNNMAIQIVPTDSNGTNSNNTFFGNSISNFYAPVWFEGYNDNAQYNDRNNRVGGSTNNSGNTIANFGGSSNLQYGIYLDDQTNVVIANNSIKNGAGMVGSGAVYGIYSDASALSNVTVDNNLITLKSTYCCNYLYNIFLNNS